MGEFSYDFLMESSPIASPYNHPQLKLFILRTRETQRLVFEGRIVEWDSSHLAHSKWLEV